MSNSEQKIPISIYKIDLSEFGETDCLEIAQIIIDNTNSNREQEERFIEQKLINEDFGEFKVKIYHAVNSHNSSRTIIDSHSANWRSDKNYLYPKIFSML